MVEIGEVESGICRNGSLGMIEDSLKQMAALSVGGSRNSSPLSRSSSRNTSPVGQIGSRNTSPCRQIVKTKLRGLDEETVGTFSKTVHLDVRMEDSIWQCCLRMRY